MATFLTLQILSVLATILTNLFGILTFTTDYWTIIVYDFVKLHSYAKWIVIEEKNNSNFQIINNTNQTEILSGINSQLSTIVFGFDNNVTVYKTHKGIFRQCNYLTEDVRSYLTIPKCRILKTINNQYSDIIHGMTNPGREFLRLHNIVASCAILIMLLLFACTLIGLIVGLLNGIVLATMTVGIIYLIATMFSIFIVAIMCTILKGERKQSNCLGLEILTDHLCSSRSIYISYSFICACLLVILCFITSFLWLSLQEKQRKFVRH
ncbi:unnamed protein product [Adineta steineri]|uniref:Uncharacterized protein n=1 Tax=Adineta steineri TaxID=433720 RepID=A0A814MYZ7_9BILA|nr:unnamed protein product [Adineta steineri]CAF1206984.1 unnamed protein product [Adineta steineri]CAF1218189.1 unnamed protein product [Adineta steineri]